MNDVSMNDDRIYAQALLDFIDDSPSAFHVTANAESMLAEAGFTALDSGDAWKLKKGGKYYCSMNGTAITAFIVGQGEIEKEGFRIVTTHSDSPSIRIKPNPEMAVENHYVKLNAEVYGSPILNTWLDRPLRLAGRVSLRGTGPLSPDHALVRFDEPLLYIPNVSIHHNKDVNNGVALNAQKDMLPLMGLVDPEIPNGNRMLKLLAEKLGVTESSILTFELGASEFEKGCLVGQKGEFISSTKLDNLALFYAALQALKAAGKEAGACKSTSLFCSFDNEEVGNRTRQGAESPMLASIMERIALALGKDREGYFRAIHNSFMISADMSQCLHPNSPEKSDPVVKAMINKGLTVKSSGAQKFTSDSDSIAAFKVLCEESNVPCQYYVNRSDSPGGSAAGTSVITQIPLRSVDMGIPLLAMHSIRELGGVRDVHGALKVFARFFER
jgi:aspartyl aminopeptidase